MIDLELWEKAEAEWGNAVGGPAAHEIFARLIRADEREKWARLADEYASWGGSNFAEWFRKLAAAIRAGSAEGGG